MELPIIWLPGGKKFLLLLHEDQGDDQEAKPEIKEAINEQNHEEQEDDDDDNDGDILSILLKDLRLLQENAIKVKCPVSDCETLFGPKSVARFIPEQVLDRWVSCLTESSVLADPVYIKCPFEFCGEWFVDDERGFRIRACPKCWRVFCVKCRVGWHMGKSCKQYEVEVKLERRLLWRRRPMRRGGRRSAYGCHVTEIDE